ncbi:hypothetical protein C8J56DRAFT_1060661 [Mycena floridula]|nr:hypothetical protein C8J56DRAFT_1060661 [Mycena floridula]
MTPDEVSLLKRAGQVFVINCASTIPLTFCYGMYFLVASLTLHTLLTKPKKTLSSWILCSTLTAVFIITTVYFCLFIAGTFKLMIVALIENTDLEFLDRIIIAQNSVVQINLATVWVGGNNGLLAIFGDGIVVWRVWAVWNERRSVTILPGVLLLATLAIFITASTMRTLAFTSELKPNTTGLVIAGYAMSIATNFVAVLLIGLKAYQHRKFIKNTIGVGNSAAGKILMFLTESGTVYVILQIINICLAFLDDTNTLNTVSHLWGSMMNFFSATYPNLIILIVSYKHSIARMTENQISITDKRDQHPQTHISFARSIPPDTTIDTTDNVEDDTAQLSAERLENLDKNLKSQDA